MLSVVVFHNITAHQALEYKQRLDADGLVLNQDYTWRYQPVKYNGEWEQLPLEDSHVEFKFKDSALASFYTLKWTK